MESSRNLYETWTLSKTWGIPPSELLCIEDPLVGYYLNRAVASYGLALENDIETSTRNAKTQSQADRKAALTLKKWLREPGEELEEAPKKLDTGRGYKDPAAMFKRE